MEINSVKSFANTTPSMPVAVSQPVVAQAAPRVKSEPVVSINRKADGQQDTKQADSDNQPSEQELQNMTEHLNTFMQAISTDVKFVLHARTNQLIVQVEDTRTHKMLKECPAHELLDIVARIKDYVGGLVDRKV